MKVCPYSYFLCCWYIRGPLVPFFTTDEISVRVTKISSRIGVSWTHSLPSWFWPLYNSMKWPYYQKYINQTTLNQITLQKLSFTNIWSLHSNFVGCESFLQSNSADILALCGTTLDDSIDSGNFFEVLPSFNPKGFCHSYAWSCSLCEGRTSFYTGHISGKLWNIQSPAILNFFFSDASICSTRPFSFVGKLWSYSCLSFYWLSVKLKRDGPFYCIGYDYSCADWDGLRDHFRDVTWDDSFQLSASTAASEFWEWIQVGIDVYISHCKFQIKPPSSPLFLAAYAAAIAHINHLLFVPTE